LAPERGGYVGYSKNYNRVETPIFFISFDVTIGVQLLQN